ncbi:MAG: hypothetical protein MK135_02065 [Polyangiaceae bacterium]|nr:hypothetical protein [Polyangiaceae bacterium]
MVKNALSLFKSGFYSLSVTIAGVAACHSQAAPQNQIADQEPSRRSRDCGNATWCEDFESYSLGQEQGVKAKLQGDSALSIETVPDGQGGSAIKAIAAGRSTAFLELAPLQLGLSSQHIYGRFRVLLESAPTESVHWTLLAGSGTRPDGQQAIYRYGGQHRIQHPDGSSGSQWMANYETPEFYSNQGEGSDCWHHAAGRTIDEGRWLCVEWEFDGENDAMHLWLDGQPAEDLSVEGVGQGCLHQKENYPWSAPKFETISIGWESYQEDDSRTIWIDDIALSNSERLGCSRLEQQEE